MAIQNSKGERRAEPEQIRTFVEYYNELFKSTNPAPQPKEFMFSLRLTPGTVGMSHTFR